MMQGAGTVNEDIEAIYRLTPLQEGMLFHSLLDAGTTDYLLQMQMNVGSGFNETHARRAFELLVERHDALRTSFTARTSNPVQVVRKTGGCAYRVVEIEDVDGADALRVLVKRDLAEGFDLEAGGLARITQIRRGDEVTLLWTLHHIIVDGWCLSIIMRDFIAYYDALCSGVDDADLRARVLAERASAFRYRDFIGWRSRIDLAPSLAFWKERLAGYEEAQVVPFEKTDANACDKRSGCDADSGEQAVGEVLRELAPAVSRCARQGAQAAGVTPSVFFETAFGVLLQRLTGCDDVVIGRVLSGRDAPLPGIEGAVGLFINTVPSRLGGLAGSVKDALRQVSEMDAASAAHSLCSLADIQTHAMGQAALAGLYAFENYYFDPRVESRMRELGIEVVFSREKTNYPLTLRVKDKAECYELTLLYDPSLFSARNARCILDQLVAVIDQMCDIDLCVDAIAACSPGERFRVLEDFSAGPGFDGAPLSVPARFSEQARAFSGRPAVSRGDRTLSYAELDALSDAMAADLARLGVRAGSFVALISSRSIELVAAIVAVVKLRAIYVPVDASYPVERRETVLDDVKPALVLLDEETSAAAGQWPTYAIASLARENTCSREHDQARAWKSADSDDCLSELLYVMYTSGTTGKPKGVAVPQCAVLRLVCNPNFVPLNEDTVILQMGAIAFDASTFEIWGALLNGGRLCLAEPDTLSSTTSLRRAIVDFGVNTMWMTAALFNAHVDEDATVFRGVEHLLIGGERLSEPHVRAFKAENPRIRLLNGYGPTENTTFTTTWEIPDQFDRIPIGRPIRGTRVYIADGARCCGVGVPGELLCAGWGLACGYLHAPELTGAAFVQNPFGDGCCYKTGDMARWLPDGSIEYLGRADAQVKIRGFRIELSEVERALLHIEGVNDCTVVVRSSEGGDTYLAAFLVGRTKLPMQVVRNVLRETLPEYMVPACIMWIEKLPLSPNGKVDKRALPQTEVARAGADATPLTPAEQLVADAFASVLGVSNVGRDESFFDLGGHSLRAMKLINRIEPAAGVRVSLQDIFSHPTPASLAVLIDKGGEYEAIPHASVEPDSDGVIRFPVSYAQRRMLVLNALDPNGIAYNMPACLRISETLDLERFKRAAAQLVVRNAALRTTFSVRGGAFVQEVHPVGAIGCAIEVGQANEGFAPARALESFCRPFNLSQGPLVRMRLISSKSGHSFLLIDMHHIISDGMSVNILARELLALYEGRALDDKPLQYHDWCAWEAARDRSGDRKFWRGIFQQGVEPTQLPLDYTRPARRIFEGARVLRHIGGEERRVVRRAAAQAGCTEFAVLMAALVCLLWQYGAQEDIAVGTVVSGRTHRDTEQLLGLFVNTLVIVSHVKGDMSVKDLVNHVASVCVSALEHQDYPFDLLCEDVGVKLDGSRNPLFDVMFSYQNNEALGLPRGFELVGPAGPAAAKFDLSLDVMPTASGYRFDFTYCTSLFSASFIECFADRYELVLWQIATCADVSVRRLARATLDEQRAIALFAGPKRALPSGASVLSLMREQACLHPNRTAVWCEDDALTYAAFSARVDSAAAALRSAGVKPGDVVAIMCHRSILMVVALWGVLRAGAAYVPIEPSFPAKRIALIVENAHPRLLVTDSALPDGIEVRTLSIEECCGHGKGSLPLCSDESQGEKAMAPPAAGVTGLVDAIDPMSLAYIIYTSGSTGTPKGVCATHRGLLNVCLALHDEVFAGEPDAARVALVASYCFDASIQHLFTPLCFGHTLYVVPDDVKRSGSALSTYLAEHRIDVMDGTPAHLHMLLERGADQIFARTLVIGGEAMSPAAVERIHSSTDIRLFNAYGPTEATVDATLHRTTLADGTRRSVPIGRPLPNVEVSIEVDGVACGIGMPGEIFISGAGVSAGYLNLPELTAERFISVVGRQGRVYRTGDVGRWLHDGTIEYLGRSDGQVKVRGFRIEVGEVTNALAKHVFDREAVVVARKVDGEQTLCAYIAAPEGAIGSADVASLKRLLRDELPSYMVPTHWARVDVLPLDTSGKLQPSKLPIDWIVQSIGGGKPLDDYERIVADAFECALKLEQVGRTDDFFELGGHSLRANTVLNHIEEHTAVRLALAEIFKHPTVEALAGVLRHAQANLQPIPQLETAACYALSPAQERIYLAERLNPGTIAYNMPVCLRIEGAFEVDRARTALDALVARHEALRTRFGMHDDELVQFVDERAVCEFSRVDVREFEAPSSYAAAFVRPFDLERGPMIRARVICAQSGGFLLFLDVHHIVADGFSMGVLAREFAALYDGRELAPLRVQYKDYAAWARTRDVEADARFWQEQFDEPAAPLDLPLDFARPRLPSMRGGAVRLSIPQRVSEAVRCKARAAATTEYTVYLAALFATLGVYGRTEDIVIGTAAAGRSHHETASMVGMFVNTLALRAHPKRDVSFNAFLAELAREVVDAFDHQEYPFEDLVQAIAPERDLGRGALFDVLFTYQSNEEATLAIEGARIHSIELDAAVAKFDLDIDIVPSDSGHELSWGFNLDVFTADTAQLMAAHYLLFLERLVAKPDKLLGCLDAASDKELSLIDNVFHRSLPPEWSVGDVFSAFEAQALRSPDACALICGDERCSYSELDERIACIAHELAGHRVTAGSIVVVLKHRSVDLIACLLAIMKCGAAYFCLDISFPPARIASIIEDAHPVVVVADADLAALATPCETLILGKSSDDRQAGPSSARALQADDLAYLCSTSGSTGVPKSVMIEHGGLFAYVQAFAEQFSITDRDVVLQQSPWHFDTIVEEVYPVLCCGGTVALYPEDKALDPADILAYAERVEATVISCSTLMLAEFNRLPIPSSLRLFLNGGDTLVTAYIDRLQSVSEVGNTFGPTECTVCAALDIVQHGRVGRIAVGRPIPGTRIHVVGASQAPCGVGVPGELLIAGAGVGRGYLNRPNLTADKFIENPFGSGRAFRTGDVARWLPDGRLEFMGRADEQVKIRGFRVEPGEVEACARAIEGVRDCGVVAWEREGGDRYLAGYYVLDEDAALDSEDIGRFLRARLASYMVPERWMQLEALPITGSGKIARRLLPKIAAPTGAPYEEPATDAERAVAAAFSEVLGVPRVGRADDFFDLGGHSLRALRLVNAVEERTGARLALADVFSKRTVAALAGALESAPAQSAPIRPAGGPGAYPMSSMQRRLFAVCQLDDTGTAYNMPCCLRLAPSCDVDALAAALAALVARHEALRTSFRTSADGEPVQVVAAEADCPLDVVEGDAGDPAAALAAFVRPFDLSRAPLLRARVVRGAAGSLLLVDVHHIVADGASVAVMVDDLARLASGERLEPLRVQYKDYALWARERGFERERAHWAGVFAEAPDPLDLPTDFPRPARQSFAGACLPFSVTARVARAVRALAEREGATEFMVLAAALAAVLGRMARSEDVVVGTAAANRPTRECERMLGMFANTLALRLAPRPSEPFSALVAQAREACLGAFANQAYPFDELVSAVGCERDLSRAPLVEVMFAFQNGEPGDLSALGLSPVEAPAPAAARFDLSLSAAPREGGYACELVYATALFSPESASYLARHFARLLEAAASDPDAPLGSIDMRDEAEARLVSGFSPLPPSAPEATFHGLFEARAAAAPGAPAVVAGPAALSYAELDARANGLALALAGMGLGPGGLAALACERGWEMVCAALAVMKCGAAYVPLDPSYPPARFEAILSDARPALVLALGSPKLPDGLAGARLVRLDDWSAFGEAPAGPPAGRLSAPSDLAYVIYTSGTTGRPKGVMVEHRGLAGLAAYFSERAGARPGARCLMFASLAFDASVAEMAMSLLNGGTAVVASEQERHDPAALRRLLERERVGLAILPPALVPELDLSGLALERVITAGSASSRAVAERVMAACAYSNDYGPTESTVCVSGGSVSPADLGRARIPVGLPAPGARVVVAQGAAPCGVGVPGELWAGGPGCARGYLGAPGLTAERFADDPFGCGRMYRTGDVARWLPDGRLEFMGRADEQVKIRGFRVEPEGVAEAIRRLPGVSDCAVVAAGEGERARLEAYCVCPAGADLASLRAALRRELPEYLVPSAWARLDRLPLTERGKLDRAALPEPEAAAAPYEEPATDAERAVAAAFSEVLGVPRVGRADDFFDLGGDSIGVMRLKNALNAQGWDVEMADIFKLPVVRHVARALIPLAVGNEEDGSGELAPTPIMRQFDAWDLSEPDHFNQSTFLELPDQVDAKALEAALAHVTTYHDCLRIVRASAGSYRVRPIDESENFTFLTYDLSVLDDEGVRALCQKAQESFNVRTGPLVAARLFTDSKEAHLFICIHHLAIDAVSWNILLDDLQRAYAAALTGRAMEAPTPALSYRSWARMLAVHAESEEVSVGLDEWRAVTKRMRPLSRFSSLSECRQSVVSLGAAEFAPIRECVQSVLSASVHEVVMAACAWAVGEGRPVSVMVESHGRGCVSGVIPTRTVGWFTSEYPVIVEPGAGLLSLVANAHRACCAIVDDGLGYALLRHVRAELPSVEADFGFNYFGEEHVADASVRTDAPRMSHFSAGEDIAAGNRFLAPLTVSGSCQDGALLVSIERSEAYVGHSLQDLAARVRHALLEIARACDRMKSDGTFMYCGHRVSAAEFESELTSALAPVQEMSRSEGREKTHDPNQIQKMLLDVDEGVVCCHRSRVKGYGDEEVRAALVKLSQEQVALRLFYDAAGKQFVEIPRLGVEGIVEFDVHQDELALKRLSLALENAMHDTAQLMKAGRLTQLVHVRVSDSDHIVYFFAHHSVWDLRSAAVFEKRLYALLDNEEQVRISCFSGAHQKPDGAALASFLSGAKDFLSFLDRPRASRCIVRTYECEGPGDQMTEDVQASGSALIASLVEKEGFAGSIPVLAMVDGRGPNDAGACGMFLDLAPLVIARAGASSAEASSQQGFAIEKFGCIGALTKLQAVRFARQLKKLPVLNATVTYGDHFGLTDEDRLEEAIGRSTGKDDSMSLMLQIRQQEVKIIANGFTLDDDAFDDVVGTCLGFSVSAAHAHDVSAAVSAR